MKLSIFLAGVLAFFISGAISAAAKVNSPDGAVVPVIELEPLFEVITKRLGAMHNVAIYKWHNRFPIEDLKREQDILKETTNKAMSLGLEAEPARNFFQVQIDAAKTIQRGWHQQWSSALGTPGFVLPSAPDLNTQLRPELNRLGEQIMTLLAKHASSLEQLSSEELCAVFIPKLSIEHLSLDAKQKVCQNLSLIRRKDSSP